MRFLILGLLLLSSSCSYLFYQPSRQWYVNPEQQKLVFEDIWFPSKDGTKLHGWLFPAKGKVKGTLVHFHGNAENISSHFLNLIWITQQGYNYFIFDYRGYGKSPGSPNQESVNEDALAAIARADDIRNSRGGGQLIVYGQSLGSVISARAVSEYDQSKISLLVQDSPFYSYKKIAFDRLTDVWFLIPFSPLGFALVSDEYASWPILEKLTIPTLVITGSNDTITPPLYGRYIYKHVGAQKKWWWKTEAKHINVYFIENGKYRQDLVALLSSL